MIKLPSRGAAIFAVLFLLINSQPANAAQVLQGHVPKAVANLQPVDRLPGSTRLDFAIGLPLRNMDELTNLLEQIYDPSSANYHHYLTPEEFVARFGPTPEDYQAVITYARLHRFTVTRKHSNRTLLVLNGTVADIEEAFHVNMRVFRHPEPAENRNFFAPDQEPQLDLDTPVLHVSGLDNYIIPRPMNLRINPANPAADPAAFNGSGPSGNYIGNDFRAAYVPGVTLTGAGQSVGLLEFDGYHTSDINAYKALAKLPDVTVTNVFLDNVSGSAGKDNSEVCLDIEMAISMAPGLSEVIVYEGTSANDILTQMLSDNIAKQLSASWTYPIDSTTTNLFYQLGAQGISFFNASGDSGAYIGTPSPPTDDPFITSVGGTTLSTTGKAGPWASEKVWNWYTTGEGTAAGSGGISTTISLPSWQQGISMTANGGSTTKRNLPDVALTADNIWVTYSNGKSGEFGGTSAACPLWAAFTALVNQQAVSNGQPTMGFLNPAIYAIGKSAYYSNCFHDITSGSNTNPSTSTKFFARPGYDLCTGWGTPQGAGLIAALVPTAPLIITQPASQSSIPGNQVKFTVGAVGAGMLYYQWQFDSNDIALATNSSYTITNVQTTDQGSYSVMVSNSIGAVTSSNATLTVNIPPVITAQPQSLEIPQGSNATFTVAATGTPPPKFQWQINSTNIVFGTNSSVTITNVQPTDQGNYTVTVYNAGGQVVSSAAVLTVDYPPSIVTQPVSATVNPGRFVTFSVDATGTPTLAYQWVFDGTNIPLRTSSSYRIQNIQPSNAGSYWAVVTNNFGAATSAVATLTVNSPPAINGAPAGLSLVVGDSASFTVTTTGSALSYQWSLNGINLADNGRVAGSSSSNLTINSVVVADAGNYQVVVTNTLGGATSGVYVLMVAKATPSVNWAIPAAISYGTALGSGQLNATANVPGTFAYTPVAGVTPNAGTNSLSTVFTPNDPLDFNSMTNTVSLLVSPGSLVVTATNATRIYGDTNPVFMANVTGAVNGDAFTANASCAATPTNLPGAYPIVPSLVDTNNRAGNYMVSLVNGTLTITPAAAPTIISVTPNTGSTNGGDSVTILGTGFQSGATLNFGPLPAVSVNVTNSTNIIAVTPAANLGAVDVVLTNADGQTVDFTNGYTYATAPVTNLPPQITGQPTNQSALPGSNAMFTVTATGTAPLMYQWALNNTNLPNATNFALALSNIQPGDAGPYQAVVTNLYGATTSSVATLSVLGVPASFITSPGGLQYANGQFILQLGGLTGQGPVIIQSSTDLTNWLPIFTNPPGFGQFQFIDTNASNFPNGYYRAITPSYP